MRVESTHILNLEATYIYKANLDDKKKGYKTDKKKKDKDGKDTKEFAFTKDVLYSATIPYSLETMRAFEMYPSELIDINGKYESKLFVNVNFTKHHKIKNEKGKYEVALAKDKIRKELYVNGFKIDGVEYCMFKRGGSKARTASAIFVKKECYSTLYNRCLLGLNFQEDAECDLTSKNAYISLIMSGIIGTVNIKREEILIIGDVMGKKIKVKASVTERNENNEIVVNDYEDYEVQNNMTDGQGLLDESVFEENELTRGRSVALLRNDFTKCAAFNTKLQAYYQENNIDKVYDMYRGWVDSKDIKLIITPSSCKFLKFSNKFLNEKECYLHWWNNIDSTFGVVKTDHVGNYGYANRLSYQMINSLELNYEEIKKIAQDEISYIKMLKNNCLVDRCNNLSKKQKIEITKQKNDMSYFMQYIGNTSSREMTSGEIISDLFSVNSNFRFTKQFKEYKKNLINNYISDVRKGKLRIRNSLYSILFSCPYTMLKQTIQEEMVDECISSGWEVYCPNFKNLQELCMIRNPQINSGNIAHVINKYHDEYRWFNLSDFIVVLNTYDVDIMNRLQGCDFDIDSALLLEDKTIVSKAKECMDKYYTPINAIKGSTDLKKDNLTQLAELDNYLGQSTRTIGQIVNKSAICNAYMWDSIANKEDGRIVKKFYDASSMLSSFSQIAIDMAKKSFMDNEGNRMSLLNEMQKINSWSVDGNEILKFDRKTEIYETKQGEQKERIVKKMIVPNFFNEIADNSFRKTEHFKCGMDYLQDVMDNELGKTLGTKLVDIKELLVKKAELDEGQVRTKKIDNVLDIITKANRTINWCKTQECKDTYGEKARYSIARNAKKKAINKLKEEYINEATILVILKRCFGILSENTEKKKRLVDMTTLVLNLMYLAYTDEVVKCFKSENEEKRTILVKRDHGEVDIFGTKYILKTTVK